MESQCNVELGTENGGLEKQVSLSNNKRKFLMKGWDIVVMRFLAMALSLAAAVVIGVDKQTMTLPAPINIQLTAKYQHLSAFVYLVVANSIACAYAAISLLLTLAKMGRKKNVSLMIILVDLSMVALLFSSIGAATAVGLIGYQGNSHVQWNKVCDGFDKFCDHGVIAMCFSGAASGFFFLLVVLATLNLHKKSTM